MNGRYQRHFYRYPPVRRRRNWLAMGGRIGLALWTVALVVGLLSMPGAGTSPRSVSQVRTPGAAVAASTGSSLGQAKEGSLVSLNALAEMQGVRLPKGTPLAFLNSTRFPVDGRGRVLAPEAAARRRDLPMISCAEVEVDPERHQVVTGEVLAALEFLAAAQQTSLSLFHRISQVAIEPEWGLVLYLEAGGVPVLVGTGHTKRKVAYLATVLRHLDTDQGLANVKFLDLRLNGQVVARLARTS